MTDQWTSSCEKLIAYIPKTYPWWFDGENADDIIGDHYLLNITLTPVNKFLGEDCVICEHNIGQNPVMIANYKSKSTGEPLCFFTHPACAENL